jgi:hypothetical protein
VKYLVTSLLSVCLLAVFAPIPAGAKGEINVERPNGDTDVYSGVEIHNTQDILYFKDSEADTIFMISKNQCDKEGELIVCNKARLGLDTQGVIEELKVKEIHLFINPTKTSQPIQGSQVTLSPGTVLLEVVTEKGTYISALGKIDSTTKPEGASR